VFPNVMDMKGYNLFLGLVFLLKTTELIGGQTYLGLNAAPDFNCSNLEGNATNFIKVVGQHLQLQADGVTVLTYCDEGCTDNAPQNCASRETTYKMMFKISGEKPATVTRIDVRGNSTIYGFVCASFYDVSSDSECKSSWRGFSSLSGTTTPQPPNKHLGLKIGIPVALAALAGLSTAAGLLYRKLQKKNGVSDESDTSGILGGTPVVSMEEAPNSVPPAGTA